MWQVILVENIIKPLIECFFGPASFGAHAPSNQAARLLDGRTLHSSAGLNATSSLKAGALALKGEKRKRHELRTEDLACWAVDEAGQCSGSLLHASALRCTYGRARKHNLLCADYSRKQEYFGRMPLTLILGDFLQLPPVPACSSLMYDGPPSLQYEHRQGKAIVQQADYVFGFKKAMRFSDPNLTHILQVMREGGTIHEQAWQA